jgi:hypothetical protein
MSLKTALSRWPEGVAQKQQPSWNAPLPGLLTLLWLMLDQDGDI